jgi:hypothetical protein
MLMGFVDVKINSVELASKFIEVNFYMFVKMGGNYFLRSTVSTSMIMETRRIRITESMEKGLVSSMSRSATVTWPSFS